MRVGNADRDEFQIGDFHSSHRLHTLAMRPYRAIPTIILTSLQEELRLGFFQSGFEQFGASQPLVMALNAMQGIKGVSSVEPVPLRSADMCSQSEGLPAASGYRFQALCI